jgi:hypothetical protein
MISRIISFVEQTNSLAKYVQTVKLICELLTNVREQPLILQAPNFPKIS